MKRSIKRKTAHPDVLIGDKTALDIAGFSLHFLNWSIPYFSCNNSATSVYLQIEKRFCKDSAVTFFEKTAKLAQAREPHGKFGRVVDKIFSDRRAHK